MSTNGKSATVLLISANCETSPAPVYPLGIAKLAWALEDAGFTTRQYDILVHGREALPQVLRETRPALIGISMRNVDNIQSGESTSYIPAYRSLMEDIRRHSSSPIVLGGSGFSLFPEEFMRMLNPQFGVIGPGEAGICEIARAVCDGSGLQNAPRLLSTSALGAGHSARLGAAALHDPTILQHHWTHGGMIGFQTKRGCPLACSYCTYPLIDGANAAMAEPGELVDAIERMLTEHGVNYLFMVDSVFNLHPQREMLFAEELCRRALSVSWCGFFRPSGIGREYLALLKRAGLTHMEFGDDALCDSMLRSYGKSFTAEQVLATSRLAADLELFQAHYLLLGGPGETLQTLEETLANASKLTHSVILPFAGLRIYPRTGLYRTALREGILTPEMDCVVPRFYFAPGLDAANIWAAVGRQATGPNRWILPGDYASLAAVTNRMRRRGMKGPLWEYAIQ